MKRAYILVAAFAMLAILAMLFSAGCGSDTSSTTATTANAGNDNLQQQIDELKSGLPKFAVPMREVGDRFANMYYAAKGGNWGLAAYMSRYTDKAMNPAKVTKPEEYPNWASFYANDFDPINKAIAAKDFDAFDQAYSKVIESCNACHASMGYTFIVISKADQPSDTHVDYNLASEPTDLPK
jgi:hypothetical protein